MPAPPFACQLMGWRAKGTPNTSDAASDTSKAIATKILELLQLPQPPMGTATGARDPGPDLEAAVEQHVAAEFAAAAPDRGWLVKRGQPVDAFAQYEHLSRLQQLIEQDESRTLSSEIGRDYIVRPDVTVSVATVKPPLLHAAISCKWTLRSDRAQNVRHEAVILTRHRRGRQPHIIAVTAEPLPSRITALARGTGEVDAVYHLTFAELRRATEAVGTRHQRSDLEEMINQRRLLDYNDLVRTLLDG